MITFLTIMVGALTASHIILIIRFLDLMKQVRHLQVDRMRDQFVHKHPTAGLE